MNCGHALCLRRDCLAAGSLTVIQYHGLAPLLDLVFLPTSPMLFFLERDECAKQDPAPSTPGSGSLGIDKNGGFHCIPAPERVPSDCSQKMREVGVSGTAGFRIRATPLYHVCSISGRAMRTASMRRHLGPDRPVDIRCLWGPTGRRLLVRCYVSERICVSRVVPLPC